MDGIDNAVMRRVLLLALVLAWASCALAQTPTLIQHTSGSNTDTTVSNAAVSAGGTYNLPWAQTTLSGNALICGFTLDSSGPPTLSMQDDASNTWTSGITVTDATHGVITALFYSVNSAPATVAQVKFTGHSAAFVQMSCSEFNNIALSSPTDGSNSHVDAGSTAGSSGAFTTTADGDLIYQVISIDSGASPTFSQGTSPFVLLSADEQDGWASQYQIQPTHGSITPQLPLGTSKATSSVGMAFKATSAGTARPAGIRILRMLHNNTRDETSTPITLHTPTKDGNLYVLAQSAGGTYVMSTITDTSSNTWTSIGTSSVTPDSSSMQYSKAPTTSAALTLTVNMTGSSAGGHGSSLFFYEIIGADGTAPLDTSFGTSGFAKANGTDPTGVGTQPVSTLTATPSGTNELAIIVGSMAADTATGWSTPTGAQQAPTTYTGQTNPAHADENNPAGVFFNGASTAAQTWAFTHDTINTPGVGTWVVVGAAFKAPTAGASSPAISKRAKLEKVDPL